MRNIGSILFLSVILLTSTITMVVPPQEASAQTIANSTSTYALEGSAFTNMTGTFWKDSRYWIFNANNSTYSEKPFPYLGDTQPQHPLQWDATTETFVHQPYVAPPPTVTPATPNATPSTPPPVQQPTYQAPNYQPSQPVQLVATEPDHYPINIETETYTIHETVLSDFTIVGEVEYLPFPHIIVNGVAQPYHVENNQDKVIVRTNSVGGLIYDKNNCSYSIYESGWDGASLIDSVSIVGRSADINTDNWSALPENNLNCTVDVIQLPDSVTITSTKGVVTNSTGAGVQHELILNADTGIKETFRVQVQESGKKLGVTQTAHTGDILNIGGIDYNIAALDGMFMDREAIEANEAQIFEITQGLNYDIGAGWDRLWGISFEAGVPNKINLDYANAGEIEQTFLEIDPEWTTSVGTTSFKNVVQGNSAGSTCDTTGTHYQDTYSDKLQHATANSNSQCREYVYEWDVSGVTLPDNAIVQGVTLEYSQGYNNGNKEIEYHPFTSVQPSTLSGASGATTIKTAIYSSTPYLTAPITAGTSNTVSLGNQAGIDYKNNSGWFSTVLMYEGGSTLNSVYAYSNLGDGTLGVSYTIPPPYLPPAPSNLQTGAINSNQVNLEWTEPTGLTEEFGLNQELGYKVYKSDYAYAGKNLPGQQGQDSSNWDGYIGATEMDDNELLFHFDGLEGQTTTTALDTDDIIAYYEMDASTSTLDGTVSGAVTTASDLGNWAGDLGQAIAVGSTSNTYLLNDDFSSDNWTNVGGFSNWGVSSGTMEWTTARGTTQGEVTALSSSADDFVLRYKFTPTTVVHPGGNEEYLWVGLSDNNSCVSNTAQEQAGVYFHNWSTSDSKFQVTSGSSGLFSGAVATSINFSSTEYWIEVTKSGSDVTLQLYSDAYTTPVSGGSATSSNANGPYDYVVMCGMTHSSSGSGSALGTIDDMTVTADVTTYTYHRAEQYQSGTNNATPDFVDDFSTDKGWVTTDGQYVIDTTTDNRVEYAVQRTNQGSAALHFLKDLQDADALNGSNLDNEKFVLRFKLTSDSVTGSGSHDAWFNFGLYSGTSNITVAEDFLGLDFKQNNAGSGSQNMRFGTADNSASYTQTEYVDTSLWMNGSDEWYMEIVRTASDSAVLRIFSDDTYSGTPAHEFNLSFGTDNPQDLRYLGGKVYGSNHHPTYVFGGVFDDVEIYNGVTTASTPVYSYRNFADLGYAEDTERFVGQEFGSGQSPITAWTNNDLGKPYGDASLTSDSIRLETDNTSTSNYPHNSMSRQLSSTLSDSEWVMRFVVDWDSVTSTLGNAYFNVMLTDDMWLGGGWDGQNENAGQGDFISFMWHVADGKWGTAHADNFSHSQDTDQSLSNSGSHYFELKRNSSTEYQVDYYGTSGFTGTPTTKTKTINSSINNLDTISIGMPYQNGAGVWIVDIKEIQVCNGNSDWSSCSTSDIILTEDYTNVAYETAYADLIGTTIDNVQLRLEKVGSPTGQAEVGIWNSANTKVHSFGNYDMSSATGEQLLTLASSAGWIPQDDSKINVNTSTQKIDFSIHRDTSNDSLSKNIGAYCDTECTLRFNIDFSTFSAPAGGGVVGFFGIGDSASDVDTNTAQDFIGLMTRHSNSEGEFFATAFSDSALTEQDSCAGACVRTQIGGNDILGSNGSPTTDTYSVEIKRTSATSVTISIWENDDSFSGSADHTQTLTISSDYTGFDEFVIKNNTPSSSSISTYLAGTLDNLSSDPLLTLTYTDKTFTSSTPYTIQAGDKLGMLMDASGSDDDNFVQMYYGKAASTTVTEAVNWTNFNNSQEHPTHPDGTISQTGASGGGWRGFASSDRTWATSDGFTVIGQEHPTTGDGPSTYYDSNMIGITDEWTTFADVEADCSSSPMWNCGFKHQGASDSNEFTFFSESPDQRRIGCGGTQHNHDSSGNISSNHEMKIEVLSSGTVNFYWDGSTTPLQTCTGASGDYRVFFGGYDGNSSGGIETKVTYDASTDYDSSLSKLKYGTFGSLEEGLPEIAEQSTGDQPDWENEYLQSDTTWTQVNSCVSLHSADKIQANNCPTNADHRIHNDLGSALDNEEWVYEFNFDWVSNTSSTLPVALTSSTGNMHTANHDAIGVFMDSGNIDLWYKDNGGSYTAANDAYSSAGNCGSNNDPPDGTCHYYMTLTRTSATTVTLEIRNGGSHTGTLLDTVTQTIPASVQDLRYLQHGTWSTAGGSSGQTWNLDNSRIFDGMTSYTPYTITQPYVAPVTYDLRFQSTLGNAQSGSGLDFDGSDDYVSLGTDSSWNFLHDGSPHSISFWAKADTLSQSDPAGLIATTNAGGSSQKGLAIFIANGDMIGYYQTSGSAATQNSQDIYQIPDTDWHHYIFTYDGSLSADNLVMYVDGVQHTTGTKSGTFGTGSSHKELELGRTSQYFDGKLDEVVIYDYVLDYFAVETLHDNGNGRDPSTLQNYIQNNVKPVAYYNLDDGGATNQYPPDAVVYNVCEDITGENCSAVQVFTFDNASASNTFDLGAQCTYCQDSALSSDGSKLYVFGAPSIWNNAAVFEYDLATPYDVTTGSYVHEFDATAEISIPQFVEFSSDGTMMFYGGSNQGIIYQRSLSTAWDVSTAGSVTSESSYGSNEMYINGIAFKSDGTKVYVIGSQNADIHEYDLSTPWDITTETFVGTYDYNGGSLGGQDASGMHLTSDGTKMYVADASVSGVVELELSTPYTISTASETGSEWIESFGGNPNDVHFREQSGSLTDMYVVGSTDGNKPIHHYPLTIQHSVLHDGTITGTSQATGIVGKAMDFDGSNDYIDTTDYVTQSLTDNASLSFWIKPETISDNDVIFDDSNVSSGNNGIYIRFESGNLMRFGINGATDTNVVTSGVWTTNEWQHVSVVFDGTDGKIYRNGVEEVSGAMTALTQTPSYQLRIGWGANGNDNKYDGLMDEVYYFDNKALTQAEVTSIYNAGLARTQLSNAIVSVSGEGTYLIDESGIHDAVYGLVSTTGTTTENITWDGLVNAQDNGGGNLATTGGASWNNWAKSDKTWSASSGFTVTFNEVVTASGNYQDSSAFGITSGGFNNSPNQPDSMVWDDIYTAKPDNTYTFFSEDNGSTDQRRVICPGTIHNHDGNHFSYGGMPEQKIEVLTDGTVNFYWDGSLLQTCSGATGDMSVFHFSYEASSGGHGAVSSTATVSSSPTFESGKVGTKALVSPQVQVTAEQLTSNEAVSISSNAFSPTPKTITTGSTVTWTNNETGGYANQDVVDDDFSSDNFTHSGSNTSVSSGTFNFSPAGQSSTNGAYHQVSVDVPDDDWTLRAKLDITGRSAPSGDNHQFFIALSDNSGVTTDYTGSGDYVGFGDRVGTGTEGYRMFASNDGGNWWDNIQQFSRSATTETLYVEMKRVGGTTFSVELFDDAAYSNSLEVQSMTIDSSLNDLQYLTIFLYQGNGTGGDYSGTVDDLTLNALAEQGVHQVRTTDGSTSTDLTSSANDLVFTTTDGGTLSADSKIFTSTASTGFNSHATGDSCTVGSQVCSFEMSYGSTWDTSTQEIHWFGWDVATAPSGNNYQHGTDLSFYVQGYNSACGTSYGTYGFCPLESYTNGGSQQGHGASDITSARIEIETNGDAKYYKDGSLVRTETSFYTSGDVIYPVSGVYYAGHTIPMHSDGSARVSPIIIPPTIDSGNISAGGGTFSHTFNTAGTYNYECPLHSGMTGQIVVADSYSLPSGTEDFTVSAWTKTTQADGNLVHTDDFSSDLGWSHQGNQNANGGSSYAETSISNNSFKLTSTTDGSGSQQAGAVAVYDLGSPLSDNAWIARFTINEGTSLTTQGNEAWWFILSNDNTFTTSEGINLQGDDAIGFRHHLGNEYIRTYEWDGGSSTSANKELINWSSNQDLWFELTYDGTDMEVKRYTDGTYASVVGGSTFTHSAGDQTGLQYINIGNPFDTSMGNWEVFYDDIQICSGETDWANCSTIGADEIGTVLSFETQEAPTTSPMSPAPLVHYDFEQTTTALTNQGSGGATYDGTGSGTTTGQTGKLGNAWDFASGDHIQIPNTLSSSEFSVNMWINPDVVNANQGLWWHENSGGTNALLYLHSSGVLRYYDSGVSQIIGSNTLSAGTWYMVTIVHDASGVKVYLDGSEEMTGSGTASFGSGGDHELGREWSGDNYDGQIDQTLLFNSAISTDTISTLYNSGNGKSPLTVTTPAPTKVTAFEVEPTKMRIVDITPATTSSITQGNAGGAGVSGQGAGGGGGAGAASTGKHGGDGIQSDISGSNQWYAGGGGAAYDGSSNHGNGGQGGGGQGGSSNTASSCGTNGTGGGAGGGGNVGGNCGDGGSGVVIVSYPTADLTATGGTVTTSGSNTIHTFASGSTSGTTGTLTVSSGSTSNARLLIVAGGGGSMENWGHSGGAGAGGLIELSTYGLSSGSYAVVVGEGGQNGGGSGMPSSGGDSSFGTIVAVGGGYGGNWYSGSTNIGGVGGSGGGGQTGYDGGEGTTSTIQTGAEVRTNILEQTVSITPNTWKHVSWVRDGTSWKSIVDGTQVGNTVTQATSLGTAKPLETSVSGTQVYQTSDFTNGSWDTSDSSFMYISGGELNWRGTNDGSNNSIAVPLGQTLSDEEWIARFAVEITDANNGSLAPGQDRNQIAIGLANQDHSVTSSGNHDAIYFLMHLDRDGTDRTYLGKSVGYGMHDTGTRADDFSTTTYYVELKRTSTTDATMTIYSDSGYSSTALSTPSTLSLSHSNGTPSGLDHFKVTSSDYSYPYSNLQGKIHDLLICSGVTDVNDCTSDTIAYGDPTYHIGTQPDGTTNPLAVIDELHVHSAPAETVVAKSHDRGDAEFNLVGTVPFATEGATTTFADTSVTPGDAPIYQIYSYNLAGETELQTMVQGSTVSLANAPTNLQVTNGITQAQLTWTVSSDLGGGNNMGSAIYRSTDNLNWTLEAQQSSTTPAYTDTTANVLGQTYYYKVATVNEAGIGAQSSSASVTIADSPDAPTGLTATPAAGKVVVLDWTIPNDNGAAIASYSVDRSADGGTTWGNVATVNTNQWTDTDQAKLIGTTYFYQVSATNSVGVSPESASANALVGDVPDAVTVISATAQVNYEIDVVWTAPNDNSYAISSYDLYQDDGINNLKVYTGPNTSFTSTGLTAGTIYSYNAVATNALGVSPTGTSDVATAGDIPSAPSNLTVTVVPGGQLDLSWTTANGNGYAFTGEIQVSTDGGSTWTQEVAAHPSASTQYQDTGLTNGVTYDYRVNASNALGTSGWSNVAGAKAGNVPDAPPGLSATTISSSEIDVQWLVPSDNGYAITQYNLERSVDQITWTVIANQAGVTFSDTGLTQSTTYYYRVSAQNALGTSQYSAVTSGQTFGVPGIPTGLTITPISTSQLDLSWTAPAMNGYAFVSYTIEQSTDGGTTWNTLTTVTQTTYSHTGLTANTDHLYRVFATNTFGSGSPSVQALAPTLPEPPAAVTVTVVSDTELDVTWNTPTGSPPATVGFKLERSDDQGVTWTVVVANTGNTNQLYQDTGLTPLTEYFYRVSTINASGTSVVSPSGSNTTYGPPDAPTSLTATPLPGAQIKLDWIAPVNNNGDAVNSYQIERSLDNVSWSVLINTGTTSVTYTDTGLNTPQTYYYRVSATSGYGTGAASNMASAIASDVPDQVTGLTGTALPSAEIKLDWTTPANNGYQISGYLIERSTDGGATWGTLVADTQSQAITYTDTALTIGNTYNYRVAAINAVGTGTVSSDVAVVAGDIPSQVTLVVTAQPSSIIELTWTAPASNGYALTGYAIERSTDGTNWSPLTTAVASAVSYTDSGLTNGDTYYYRITAINAIGNSLWSAAQSAVAGDVPDQVTGLTVTTISDVSLQLQWTAPADNGYAIQGYMIERSLDQTTWTTITSNTQSQTTTFTDANLVSATDYYYRVSAVNSIGTGQVSTTQLGHTYGPPEPITVMGASSTDSTVTLTWTSPPDNGSAITNFRVEVQSFSTGQWLILDTIGGGTTTYTQQSTLSNTQYTYRIVAINAYGSSTSGTIAPYSLPVAPAGLTGTSTTGASIDLSWTAVPDANSHGLTTYNIEQSTDQINWANVSANQSGITFTATGLNQGTTYYFRVQAENPQGTGAWSSVYSQSTLSPPTSPTNFSITAPNTSPTEIRLDWSAPSVTGGDPNYTYEVQISSDNITWNVESTSIANTQTLYIDSGLPYGQQLYWRVLAVNSAGQSPATSSVTYTVPNVPTPPANLVVNPTGSTNTAGVLDWDAPANNYGYQIIGYMIERNTNNSGWVTIVPNTGSVQTVMTNTGLSSGNQYEYRVSAISSVGTSGPSNTALLDLFDGQAFICLTPTPECPTQSQALTGNTVEVNPFVDVSAGTPLPSVIESKIYQNNAPVDTNPLSQPLTIGSNIIPTMNAYPTATSDFYVVIKLDNGFTLQTNTIALTPASPFSGEFSLNEARDIPGDGSGCEATNSCYDESTLNLSVQPVGADVIVEYRSQDPSDPVITKGYNSVSGPIQTVTDVDTDKNYYITMFVNPQFEYTVDPTTLEVTVVCQTGDPLCDPEEIPKGTPPAGTAKSFRSPDAQTQLGIEPIGDLFGVPMIFIFVVGLAGLFTGRSAPMGVIFILTTIGIMAYMGYIDFENPDATWVLLLISAVIGVFIGKRYS